jgi:predicted nucleotidyltransferase component of viral defense system
LTQEKQTLRLFVENVKVELVAPKRPYLHPIETIENIRFFSVADTMAFKMNAIERRGSRKDFYDLYEALHYHDLTELIDFYCQKFSNHNPIHLIKSIIYFTDAENEPAFKSLKKTTWENIKQNIVKHHKNYLQSKI